MFRDPLNIVLLTIGLLIGATLILASFFVMQDFAECQVTGENYGIVVEYSITNGCSTSFLGTKVRL